MSGTAYGVGLGPGDPDLMTVKADRLIRNARVVAYPAPDNGESFAREIARSRISPDALELPILVPMTPGQFAAEETYGIAAEAISAHLLAGRDVVVLCQGDPFFYGTFMYLFERLSRRHLVTVVPGVTSMTACAAAAGLPLCGRTESLTVLPATMDEAQLETRLADAESAVVVKVGRNLQKVRRILERLGRLRRSTFVSHATLQTEIACPLEQFEGSAPYFSTILVPGAGGDEQA